jgi:DNA-directed RNA polymerase specialized sigma subunit
MTTPNKSFRSQTDVNTDRFIFRIQREIPTEGVELEQLVHNNQTAIAQTQTDEERLTERQEFQERRKELVEKLFVAATKVLTDIQFQIFTSYFVMGMSEPQIASSMNVTQPYISIVLTASVKKIKKELRVD